MSVPKPKRKKKTRSTSSGPHPIKDKMTKSQLTKHLIDYVESSMEVDHIASADVKGMVTNTLEGLAGVIERSIMPRGLGVFMMPQLFKVETKVKPAIKKGKLVRSPATGEMVKSKGRPASKRVKIRALTRLKKAAAGEA